MDKEFAMRALKIIILMFCIMFNSTAIAKKSTHHVNAKHTVRHAAKHSSKRTTARTQRHTASVPARAISTSELVGFDRYPRDIKKLITNALDLSGQGLAYKFGSMDPKNNGLDCSGAISYVLKQSEIRDVPRQADEIYQWAWKKGEFFAVNGHRINSFEFSELKPGDLLFWSGTYPVQRDPAVTHVMMYLGRDRDNRPLMFGATNGRTYRGRSQSGVGVFDFTVPPPHSKARFLGYACIPHLSCDT
jgi:cell wall-associated NlpC family hydrolase